MFRSNVKELMRVKGVTIREIASKSGLSSATIHKLRDDEGISECRLSTLARIGTALGVKTKKLYDEVEGEGSAEEEATDCMQVEEHE